MSKKQLMIECAVHGAKKCGCVKTRARSRRSKRQRIRKRMARVGHPYGVAAGIRQAKSEQAGGWRPILDAATPLAELRQVLAVDGLRLGELLSLVPRLRADADGIVDLRRRVEASAVAIDEGPSGDMLRRVAATVAAFEAGPLRDLRRRVQASMVALENGPLGDLRRRVEASVVALENGPLVDLRCRVAASVAALEAGPLVDLRRRVAAAVAALEAGPLVDLRRRAEASSMAALEHGASAVRDTERAS
jgi:hypothetical protein